jgi:hypothetical protein
VSCSRRGFVAAAAAFATLSIAGAPAFAHGRKGRAGHAAHAHGKTSHRHGAHAASAKAAEQPEVQTASAPIVGGLDMEAYRKLDPKGLIRKPLLAAAFVALERHKDRIADPKTIFVADFAKHSSESRLYMVDMDSGEVTAFRTAHGRGSDPDRSGFARKFSNTPGSFASSLGAYVTQGRAYGLRHGEHVGLDGLDPSNNMAKERAIIVHSADYCETPFLHSFGMLGRSEGCFATSSKEFKALAPVMGEGRLLYAGI